MCSHRWQIYQIKDRFSIMQHIGISLRTMLFTKLNSKYSQAFFKSPKNSRIQLYYPQIISSTIWPRYITSTRYHSSIVCLLSPDLAGNMQITKRNLFSFPLHLATITGVPNTVRSWRFVHPISSVLHDACQLHQFFIMSLQQKQQLLIMALRVVSCFQDDGPDLLYLL